MAIVRWSPLLSRWPNVWDWDEDESLVPNSTADNLDIFETADEVVVRASVAGVDEDKVDITFEKGVLWVKAEESLQEKEGKKYYRKATRSYSYKVAVPGNIDTKVDPKAVIEKGVVSISFKKAEEAKPKKITISKK